MLLIIYMDETLCHCFIVIIQEVRFTEDGNSISPSEMQIKLYTYIEREIL